MKKLLLLFAASAAALVTTVGGSTAQEAQSYGHVAPDEIPSAMYDFMNAWLVAGDGERAMAYFSVSETSRSLAPDRVWGDEGAERGAFVQRSDRARYLHEYWMFVNDMWKPQPLTNRVTRERVAMRERGGLGEVLKPVDQDILVGMREEFGVPVISEITDPFVVFVADNPMSIYSFDAAYMGAEEKLRPEEHLTLGMLAELSRKGEGPDPGPFVSFWQEEEDDWRIQMVGAVLP